MPGKIDLHTHTNTSDGTDSPEELLKKIQEAGIEIFAVTDHDTIKGALEMKKIIGSAPVKFIKGIEFSCRADDAKCHILGFNCDENHEAFKKVLRAGDELRHAKFFKRIEFLRSAFNVKITDEEVKELLKIPSLGKIHLGNMLVEKGFAETRLEAMENFVDKCKTGNDRVDADFAINSIISSGGVAVWAHPLGGAREPELSREKFFAALKKLISFGLHGLECYYSKYEFFKCEWLAEEARQNNLYISGGSDYHGANKNVPLGKLNADDKNISQEFLSILNIF